ncbi:5-formyltetrahydrofolate cyclo-ligase [Elizabethkingia argentiflava]|uniref:5-formyltetrahydrofolate cyclo-ligase n=2 Tax=Elizabethkingia argenteiflava TaxID=2681556 RepID=A0A845PW43_9FLAO|nr:5-formyltetrahydrofolate cyclo-ligase [Elizabethkingia argenteiflava]
MLRDKYMNKRKAMSSEDIAFLSTKIFHQYLSRFKPLADQNIHIFLPISSKKEIDTGLWVDFFWKNKIQVFVPKIIKNRIISVAYLPHSDMQLNHWGILEPVSNIGENVAFDQVITPLLYADPQGNRIGYGKGFYDRFFANLHAETLRIGLNYFSPYELISDVDEYDIKLNHLVLPNETLSF